MNLSCLMNWKRRFSKVLGSWITGYGAGLGTVFTLSSYNQWELDLFNLFVIPSIAGLIVALPQLGKVFNEYGNSRSNT